MLIEMGSIGKEIQINSVELDPSTVNVQAIFVIGIAVSEVVKTWGDYVTSTWGSVSNLVW